MRNHPTVPQACQASPRQQQQHLQVYDIHRDTNTTTTTKPTAAEADPTPPPPPSAPPPLRPNTNLAQVQKKPASDIDFTIATNAATINDAPPPTPLSLLSSFPFLPTHLSSTVPYLPFFFLPPTRSMGTHTHTNHHQKKTTTDEDVATLHRTLHR